MGIQAGGLSIPIEGTGPVGDTDGPASADGNDAHRKDLRMHCCSDYFLSAFQLSH